MDFNDIKKQKKIHFIGLGGIGMSALAFILREFNITVQGSDLAENYLTPKLRANGVTYFVGHRAENIDKDVSLIVETSIIKEENPEIIEARLRNIPIITRANLLAIVMAKYKGVTIAGTHGKTSTTGMVSVLFDVVGLDPTVINGGVIHYFGSNSRVGKGQYLVAESDESDASFVDLPSFIGAVTNLEPEHLEFKGYGGSFEKQKEYFKRYVVQIPANGMCALCIDDVEVEKIYDKLKDEKKNLITYAANKDADLRVKNIRTNSAGLAFDVEFKSGRKITDIKMPVYGKHNASNACVAIAIADFLGISDEKIKEALEQFNGVKRRFTKVGEFNQVAIIDDYGHHPTEIKATLKAARDLIKKQKLICVFEPHKYSRVASLFTEFCEAFADADYVIVSDIYSAGQSPIEGVSQDSLIEGIKKSGQKNVLKMSNPKDLAKLIEPLVEPHDMVFCTGAGKVTYWAASLEEDLKKL
jgi:UDP-N-acetylmuramate--alanine ligase